MGAVVDGSRNAWSLKAIDPEAVRRRPLAPLALTLGLHLLLVLAWRKGAAPGLQRELAEQVSTFVPVQPPPASRPKPAARAPAPRPRARQPVAVPVQAPEPVAPAASEPVDAAPLPDAPPAPPQALPGDLLASSKRMAGAVDRALRNGSSPGSGPIAAEPERKWERFAAAFTAARTSVYRDTILESHTAADGVTIGRKTVGDRVACYRSGSVGGLGPADGHSAGNIRCPAGASWTRL